MTPLTPSFWNARAEDSHDRALTSMALAARHDENGEHHEAGIQRESALWALDYEETCSGRADRHGPSHPANIPNDLMEN